MLPKEPDAKLRKDSNPLIEALFNYQLLHVEAYVVHIDMVSQNEVAFKLTQDTIDSLVEYHKEIYSIDTAANTWSWNDKDQQLKKLQEDFVQAANKFVYRTSALALEGMEEDGAGELLCGRSDDVRTAIMNLFVPLLPPPPRVMDMVRPTPLLPSSTGTEQWWPSQHVQAIQPAPVEVWKVVPSSPSPVSSCGSQHNLWPTVGVNEIQLPSPTPSYSQPYSTASYMPAQYYSAPAYTSAPTTTAPFSSLPLPSTLTQQPCGTSAGMSFGWDRYNEYTMPQARALEQVPPVPYNGAAYGQLDIDQNGLTTGAHLAKDGRINIKIDQHTKKLSNLLVSGLRKQLELRKAHEAAEPAIPEGLGDTDGLPPPPMNIVIQIVGSRGDVQPFIALGQVLKNKFNHRVRIATHLTFRSFVIENGLEFFSIGGDPAELMAFMVKNPGLMPGMDSLKSGDVGKRRKSIYEMITGCWRSCIEPGDGTGIPVSDYYVDGRSFDSVISLADPIQRPFIADAIIANPPSFAHVHIAEKMGIPLHLMFTMPWSPTQAFPHPLTNIVSSNADPSMTNFVSYALVDMLTWQGLGDVINRFRERSLGLEPVSVMWAPGMISRLRIPWTYCWSPALIPKPLDWDSSIDISGFYFLNLATNYTPPPELKAFLESGPPPVYIGFGSIVVDDPNAMTKMVFEAVKKTGQRALVSKGWGGLGADELDIPEGVYMLGNCPHDWLFQRVSCVVHHGGAGTTATGISAGRPTVVVPFFGDQPFWGAMCARAGAGPLPIAYKNLTADKLANQILEALKPESLTKAKELSNVIKQEKGAESGADSFHKQMHLPDLRCSLCPERVAVWRIKRTNIRLSTFASWVLAAEGLIDATDLKLYRPREYETETGPWDPISGGAAALLGTLGSIGMGLADFPVEVLKSLKIASNEVKEAHEKHKNSPSVSGTSTPIADSSNPSTTNIYLTNSETSSLSNTRSIASSLTATQLETDDEASLPGRTSMSRIMTPDGRSRQHRRRGSSPKSPRSRSHSLYHYGEEKPCAAEDAAHFTVESTINSAKAAGKIASASLKSPMQFSMSLAQGFHNAPKLYGDTTVRKTEKITGFQSGLKAAGKEFGYGFYDGITGLVTQPVAGARKEGAAGLFKGAAKGIGGLILKPSAAIWGIPGYTAKGLYSELRKHFGSSVQNYVIAARTAQGYEDWKKATPEQYARVVTAWKSSKLETKKGGKKYGREREHEIEEHILTRTKSNNVQLIHGFKNTKHLTWDERKELAARKDELRKQEKELKKREAALKKELKGESARPFKKGDKAKSQCKFCAVDNDNDQHLKLASSFPSLTQPATYGETEERLELASDKEMEETIQESIRSTSVSDLEYDQVIERALQASLNELHMYGRDEDAYKKAIHTSVREAKKIWLEQQRLREVSSLSSGGESIAEKSQQIDGDDNANNDDDNDEELRLALRLSLEDHKSASERPVNSQAAEHAGADTADHHHHWEDSDSDLGTEDDEDFKRTIEESKRLHTEREEQEKAAAAMTTESAPVVQP
ncbi:hypothetical protein DV737_g5216, partial [Chaetothyriales sp. CBS 132003]